MSYPAVQWTLSNHGEVLRLIGSEPSEFPGSDQTITVVGPEGLPLYAHPGEWIYQVPADQPGRFRVSTADPNAGPGVLTP